ncbi:trypsin-like peptidase domain-containing protein [Streptomyces roseifaciens]|uniref:nSTAND1 domain-containing NTPase n=1 Tax=Streptomyces roseifaciens TaxID=1488406 RepID=UPI000717FEF8|nr:trypsin-like peptidase domain-containing protein [Streptomyces roseifaciens]
MTTYEEEYAELLVRVETVSGAPAGGGLLLSADTMVTCAHVVNTALGRDKRAQDRPLGPVTVSFPLAAARPSSRATVREDGWCPIAADGSGDIAVLELLPTVAEPSSAPLVTRLDLRGHNVHAYGFPHGSDDPQGAYTEGRIAGLTGAEWFQIDDHRTAGFVVSLGYSGSPVWDDELNGVIGIAVSATRDPRLRTSYAIPLHVLAPLCEALRKRLVPACPYKGLSAFGEEDRKLFFGRTKTAEELTRLVGASGRTLAVVGPSACGKSSLLHAGVIPRLRKTQGSLIVTCRPAGGTTPIHALAAALLPELEPAISEVDRIAEIPRLATVIADGGLLATVNRVLAVSECRRLVLIIDQFEEVLDPQWQREAAALIGQLPGMGENQHPGGQRYWHVVLALRADYVDTVLNRFGMTEALRVFLVGSLSPQALREVIEGPAGGTAVAFRQGLATRMVQDVQEQPGALALLETTLELLWAKQEHGWITHQAYDKVGGALGALAQHADRVYTQTLEPDEAILARRLFTQLVRPDKEGRHTRRIVRRTSVPEELWAVGQRLVDTRLLTAGAAEGEETVELAHEELIRHWPLLGDWVKEDLAFRTWQEEDLRKALDRWNTSGQEPGELLKRRALPDAREWAAKRPDDLSSAERHFIDLSVAHRRRKRRLKRAAIGTVSAIVVTALVLGALFLYQRGVAREQRAVALSRALASTADNNSRALARPTASNLLSIAAYQTHPTPEAYTSLLGHYLNTHDYAHLLDVGDQSEVQLTADGRFAAARERQGRISIWDLHAARPARHDLPGSGFGQATLSPDGRTLAATHPTRGVVIWNMATRSAMRELMLEGEPKDVKITSATFTGDGTLVIHQSNATAAILESPAEAASARAAPQIRPAEGVDTVLGRGPGAATLVVLRGKNVSVWNRHTAAFQHSIPNKNGLIVSGDGRVLADVTCQGTETEAPDLRVSVWDLSTGKPTHSFTGGGFTCGERHGMRLDAQGRHLILSAPSIARLEGYYPRTNLSVWDLTTGKLAAMRVLPARGFKWVQAAVVTKRDELLVAVDQITSVGILRLGLGTLESLPQSTGTVEPSPHGKYLATLSYSLASITTVQLRLWDSLGRETLSATPADDTLTATSSLVFTPDEKHLITTNSTPGTVTVWSVPALRPIHQITLPRQRSAPRTREATGTPELATNAQGSLLVSYDGLVTRWDPSAGKGIGSPEKIQNTADIGMAVADHDTTPKIASRPDADQYATVTKGSKRIEIHATTGPLLRTLALSAGAEVIQLRYTGNRLRALMADGTLRSWDTSREYTSIPTTRLTSSALLGDGDTAYLSDGQQLEIWNLTTRTRDRAIPLESALTAISPGGNGILYDASFGDRRFAGRHRRLSTAVLPMNPDIWIKQLCRISTRTTLTPDELQAARPDSRPHTACA